MGEQEQHAQSPDSRRNRPRKLNILRKKLKTTTVKAGAIPDSSPQEKDKNEGEPVSVFTEKSVISSDFDLGFGKNILSSEKTTDKEDHSLDALRRFKLIARTDNSNIKPAFSSEPLCRNQEQK